MIAQLVEQGKLEWSTPVSYILPEFHHPDEKMQEATIVDFLSHRSGLAPKNFIWNQEFGQAALKHEYTIPMVNYLPKLTDLGTAFKYSHWGYATADEVVLALNKDQSFGEALKQHIFAPLGMNRTMFARESDVDNRAECYQDFSDGTPFHFPHRPCLDDGAIMQGAIGAQSCVRDLLIYYKALFAALENQTEHSTTSTQDNPLVQVPKQLQAHMAMAALPGGGENSYAMGWARTELPAMMGSFGMNAAYVECQWSQKASSSNACALAFAALIPETQGAIVVLTNGVANNDASDWIGQLLLEAYLDAAEKNDYLELAKFSVKNSNARWPKRKEDLARERTFNTQPKHLAEYVGYYYNKPKCFYIEVGVEGNTLQMCFKGNHEQWYPLEHHEYDCFT